MQEYILEAIDITKKFPGVVANDNVTFRAKKGEVFGLIGENGAGKSTLLKVLNGIYPYGTYEGMIKIDGQEIKPASPNDAIRLGIGFVPQEINVLKNLSVAENIYMGNLDFGKKAKTVNFKELYERTQKLLEDNHIDLDPKADVRKLSIGQQQMLMIARALAADPKILIMDEPTTSLSNQDVDRLFSVVRKLKEKGTCIIFVTHKLAEIMELTDRLCILRDGKNISLFEKKDYDKDKIIADMIGRQLTVMYPARNAKIGEEVFRVENLTVEHPYILNKNLVENISLSVKKGEVLGLAGLVGAGRSEVVTALFGVLKKKSGRVYINGKEVNIQNTADAIGHGLALVTEDRKKYGLIFIWSILRNISISNLKIISKLKVVLKRQETVRASKYFDYLKIKAPSMNTKVDTLSGGNQQKVVIGRSLNAEPAIVMLDEPTKGIDVGSKAEIYHLINQLAESGVAVVMISSELPELMAMCDRFIVMAEGKIAGELSKADATDAKVMELAVRTFKNL
jgi:ABC-type sugar transport system ATPase subunit